MSKTRALFLLPSLDGGGAERVFVTLLRHVSRQDLELHLAVFDRRGAFLQELPPDVTIHDLKAPRVSRGCLALLRTIWRLRPDVVFSTTTHLNIATALLRPLMPAATRLVLRETNVGQHLGQARSLRRIGPRRIGVIYRLADTVICQTDYMRDDLVAGFRLPLEKLVRIDNPVDFDRVERLARADGDPFSANSPGPHVVAVGSLQNVKGFDRLIVSFRGLLAAKPDAQLWILGQGPLEFELKQLAERLGLDDHVHFTGFQANPFRWLRHADLFVLSSRFESAPNVLLEAVACECPVVALEHQGGTRELLQRLGLESRMVASLDAWQLRWFERPPTTARELVRNHFSVERVAARYTTVLSGRQAAAPTSRAA